LVNDIPAAGDENIEKFSVFTGLGVMLLMVPINILTGNKMKKYQKAQMLHKDQRVKLMDEVLNGMKVLKLYAWEPSFAEKLLATREQEVSALKKVRIMVKIEAMKSLKLTPVTNIHLQISPRIFPKNSKRPQLTN
jgi:hypothetical protein